MPRKSQRQNREIIEDILGIKLPTKCNSTLKAKSLDFIRKVFEVLDNKYRNIDFEDVVERAENKGYKHNEWKRF